MTATDREVRIYLARKVSRPRVAPRNRDHSCAPRDNDIDGGGKRENVNDDEEIDNVRKTTCSFETPVEAAVKTLLDERALDRHDHPTIVRAPGAMDLASTTT